MKRIALLSDTHGWLDENVFKHLADCDEVWHAGDFGPIELANQLGCQKLLRGVYGNIDGRDIRACFPEQIVFHCEQVKVMLRHIGGSPPRYDAVAREQLKLHQPQLFICGHSHILKIMYDKNIQCLYINPGAAGRQGWHHMRTMVRFIIAGDEIKNCEVIELGRRAAYKY